MDQVVLEVINYVKKRKKKLKIGKILSRINKTTY